MTVNNIAYRATIYAPKGTDATEKTVLTPVAGAPHYDPFRVTTLDQNWNMIPDASFEAPGAVPSWIGVCCSGTVTVIKDTAQAFDGAQSLKVVLTGTTGGTNGIYLRAPLNAPSINLGGGSWNYVGVPGQWYTFSYYIFATGGAIGSQWEAGFEWHDAAGNWIGGDEPATVNSATVTLVAGWNRVVSTQKAPPGTIGFSLNCYDIAQFNGTVWMDAFQLEASPYATAFNGNFRPFMGTPAGRRGRMDILSKKTDTGELGFEVIDVRTTPGGSNLQRWMTSFLGGLNGLPRFARLRCLVEESLDGGATWAPYFAGRVKNVALKGGSRLSYAITVRDFADDLAYDIFTGRPHGNVYQTTDRAVTSGTSTTLSDSTAAWTAGQWVGAVVTVRRGTGVGQRRRVTANTATQLTVDTAWGAAPDATSTYSFGYAQLVSVMPVGFVYPYGGVDVGGNPLVPVTKKVDAHVGAVDATNGWASITIDKTNTGTFIERILNSTLFAGVVPTTVVSLGFDIPDVSKTIPPQFTGVAIARVTNKGTGAEGDFQVGFITHITTTHSGPLGVVHTTTSTVVGMAIRPVSYPLGVATGTPLANGAQAANFANSQTVNTKGWTISVTGILAQGDIVSFAGDPTRYRVVSAANSDGGGLSTVGLHPGLQASLVDGQAVTVQKSPARMAIPATTTAITVSVTCDMRMQDGGKQNKDNTFQPGNLLLVNDVHPAQLLRDVVLGYYGRVFQPTYDAHGQPSVALPNGANLGDPMTPMAVQDTDAAGDGRHGFNALIADGTFQPFRAIVDKSMPIRDFIEQWICKPHGLGYYFDAAGNFVPVDMRQPSAAVAGIVTVTDADVVDGRVPTWSYDPAQAVVEGSYTVYSEAIVQPIVAKIQMGDTIPTITTSMFAVAGAPVIDMALGNPDLSTKQFQIDAKGYRAMPGEAQWVKQGGLLSSLVPQQRWNVITQAIIDLGQKTAKRPYGNGPILVSIPCARSANTAAIFPGSFFILSVSSNPDPASNARGASRLIQCAERSEDGPTVQISGVDWGLAGVSGVPAAIGNPANLAGDTMHSQTCVITTLNAQNEAVEAYVCVTPTSVGSRPADGDPGWTYAGVAHVSGWTITVRNLPAGHRVWWRARTNPARNGFVSGVDLAVGALRLPSPWAYPAVDHADLASFSAPTGLAASLQTTSGFFLTWTPADATRIVEIWMAFPTTDPRQRIAVLTPGSSTFIFRGLTASRTYRVAVREIDGPTGGFAEATLDVSTNVTVVVLPPPFNIRIGRVLL